MSICSECDINAQGSEIGRKGHGLNALSEGLNFWPSLEKGKGEMVINENINVMSV